MNILIFGDNWTHGSTDKIQETEIYFFYIFKLPDIMEFTRKNKLTGKIKITYKKTYVISNHAEYLSKFVKKNYTFNSL